MADKYKLTYFNAQGRGETIRLIFAYGKTPFEDNRVDGPNWPALKSQMPWGHMPILEVNGEVISESFAIIRYLAKKFDLYGKDDFQAAKCDEYGYVLADLVAEIYKFVFASDPAKKAEVKEVLLSTHVPTCLKKLEAIQKSNGGPFLLGQRVTFADILLSHILDTLDFSLGSAVLDPYPGLKVVKATVFALPGIQEYVAKRPPPP